MGVVVLMNKDIRLEWDCKVCGAAFKDHEDIEDLEYCRLIGKMSRDQYDE